MLASLIQSRGVFAPALATAVGIGAAGLGVWLSSLERRKSQKAVPRVVLPFSAGVLLGVALFGLLPELAFEAGWGASLALFGLGYGALLAVDRYVQPVCPTCSHPHHHDDPGGGELAGFAVPLVLAAALHSFLDGWSIGLVESGPQHAATLGLRLAVPLAVTLHKIPEGIALGGILRAASGTRGHALAGCVAAEGCTILGGALGLLMTPALGTGWILYPLGLTAGWIFYLGFHAVHEEWKHGGAIPAFFPALTGLAGAAVIQRGAEALFR
ncbi:MAG TPA: ZIP family metal transporter [Bryobacteraceae bacterium]